MTCGSPLHHWRQPLADNKDGTARLDGARKRRRFCGEDAATARRTRHPHPHLAQPPGHAILGFLQTGLTACRGPHRTP